MAMTYVVELQVFTGVANPRFVLTGNEALELRRLVDALVVPTAARVQPRLGYQGMLVYASGPADAWYPCLSIANGTATVVNGPLSGRSYRAEALEKHLLSAARRAGLSNVLDQAFPR
jgi:hypothetical protein